MQRFSLVSNLGTIVFMFKCDVIMLKLFGHVETQTMQTADWADRADYADHADWGLVFLLVP